MNIKINFKKFTADDLSLYYCWCNKPHVEEQFFREGYEPKEAILKKIDGTTEDVFPFIIEINEKPIGYIQYYIVNDNCWDVLKSENDSTVGFDIFIGEEDYVGKGYGSMVVKKFTQEIFDTLDDINRVIVDPFYDNKKAIRCYKKAGFAYLKMGEDNIGTKIYIMEKKNDD